MKRLVLLAAAVATIASCAKVETFNTSQPEEIAFKAINSTMTKTSSALPQETTMGVSAFLTSGNAAYFKDAKYVYKAQGEWGGETPQYWPNDHTKTLDFFVYSPHGSTTTTYNTITATNVAESTDFLYGAEKITGKSKNDKIIGVNLLHAKALVNFKATAEAAGVYKVKSVTLNDVPTTGDVVVDYTSGVTVTWTADPVSDPAITNNSLIVVPTGSSVDIKDASTNGDILIIPSDVNAEGKKVYQTSLTVVYSMNGTEMSANINLGPETIWEAGKKYIYTLTFTADEIFFNPTVEDWTTTEVEETYDPGKFISFKADNSFSGETKVSAYNGTNWYFNDVIQNVSRAASASQYQWPLNAGAGVIAKPLSFIAYAPSSLTADYSKGGEVKIDGVKTTDNLVYAPFTASDEDNGGAPVGFHFKNPLSRLAFVAKTDAAGNNQYKIKSIAIKNLLKTGDVIITSAGPQWSIPASTCKSTATDNIEANIPQNGINLTFNASAPNSAPDAQFAETTIIPAKYPLNVSANTPAAVVIEVQFQYSTDNGGSWGSVITVTKEGSTGLSSVLPQLQKAGKNIICTLKFQSGKLVEIGSDVPSVTDWEI